MNFIPAVTILSTISVSPASLSPCLGAYTMIYVTGSSDPLSPNLSPQPRSITSFASRGAKLRCTEPSSGCKCAISRRVPRAPA